MLRAPIWITSAYFFHQVQGLVVDGLGDDLHSEFVANFGHDLQARFAQALEGVGRGARFVSAAAKKLRPGAAYVLGHRHGLVAIFDGAGPGDDGQIRDRRRWRPCRESDDRVFLFDVAADQFVRLADADQFLHARHLVQRAGFDFATISGDADGGALRARHGVGPVAQFLDLLANGADLLFGGLRLHHD